MNFDTSLLRLTAQIALVVWCAGEAAMLILLRGKLLRVRAVEWAVFGLACFALWMFISALTIRSTGLFPRAGVVWILALLELGTASGAWAHLLIVAAHTFHVSWHASRGGGSA